MTHNPTAATSKAAGMDGCTSVEAASLHETPAKLVKVSFQYMADKVLLIISCLASVVAAMQTRSSVRNDNASIDPNMAQNTQIGKSWTSANAHSEHAPVGPASDPHADAQEVQHKAKRLRSDTAADPAVSQELPKTTKSGRLLSEALKPGRIRALEKIAKSQPAGFRQRHKKRKLKNSTAAGQPAQRSKSARVTDAAEPSGGQLGFIQGSQPVGLTSAAEQAQTQDFDANVGTNQQTNQSGSFPSGVSEQGLGNCHGGNLSVGNDKSGAQKQPVPEHHRVDRMFVQPEFLKVQQQLGKEFSVDCFCRDDASNSHCKQFYSPENSFFDQQLVDQHCWINPPFNMIRETLTHYQACKQQHPDRISAVFCLPAPRVQDPPEWLHLLKGMQVIAKYKKGTRLFTGPNPDNEQQRHLLPGIRQEIILYYDPLRTADTEPRLKTGVAVQQQSGTVRLKTSHVMQIPVTISGIPCYAILDTGAEHTSMSPDGIFLNVHNVRRQGIQILPLDQNASMAGVGGQDCNIYGKARVTIKMGKYTQQAYGLVMDMDEKLDAIFGEAWLDKHKATIDYGSKTCMFVKRGRKYLVRCAKPRKPKTHKADAVSVKSHILSLTQTKRVMRKSSVWYCLALVKEIKEAGETPEITDPRVKALVTKYPTVFTEAPPKGGSSIQAEHECIPLVEGAKPTFRPMFRYSPAEMELLEKRIKELLELGYIEPSTSPYGAPVLFVKKPRSEELRLVIDYRMLNKMTVRNRFPLPRIDDMLNSLAGAQCYTSIDLRQAYHQVKLKESDKPLSAFRTPFGHYQWVTLSMGLTNAPAVFQSVVNNIFRPYLGKFVVVYLDDICVFSKNEEEHMKHLELVLDKLEEYKLTAAWHKCHFFQKQLLFLGHIVSAEGVKADSAKVKAVADFPKPTDQHQLRSFLGMCNYFRKFIQRYAPMVSPLTQLLRKDSVYEWGQKQEEAFQAVKQALISAPVLIIPDWRSDQPFEITCDASYQGLSGVLTQNGHPVAYESRKLNSAEGRYPPTELEMLAVVHCIKTWRCYIEGKEVHVYTDHKPNTTFVSNPMLTRRQARWTEELQSYNLQFHYKPGAQNVVADALSRYPVGPPAPEDDVFQKQAGTERTLLGVITASTVTKRAKQLATADTFLDKVKRGYTQDSWFMDPANVKPFTTASGVYTFKNAVVLPDYADLRQQVLAECHDAPYSAHPGRDKTLRLVQEIFWWPNMHKDVADYVKHCVSCQRNKSRNQLPAGLLQPLPIPGEPWESVSMDFVTDLPKTPAGYDSITVIVDRLTKMVVLSPSKKTDTAVDVAQLFLKEVVCRKGMPNTIVSDRDPKFTGNFFKELTKLWGVQQNLSSAFHPQTDGNTERVNRVMEDMLRHFVSPDQTNWDKLLPLVEFAINNSYHDSIKNTPFMLNFGRHPCTPIRALVQEAKQQSHVPMAQEFIQQMREAQEQAKLCLQNAQQRQRAYADQKRRDVDYQVGQKVWLSTKNITLKMVGTPKFLPKFIGPFPISAKVNPVAYKLELPPCLKMHNVFHVSLLAEYHANSRQQPAPLPVITDEGLEYEVENIIDHRVKTFGGHWNKNKTKKIGQKKVTEYLIHWSGYGAEDRTWEPDFNCRNCPDKVHEYWQKVEDKNKLELAEHMLKLQQKQLKRQRHRSG